MLKLAEIEIHPERSVVCRDGEEIYLRQQTLRVLLYLVEHRDRLVSRDELHTAIWRDTAVTPDALVQCIVDIRKALGDSSKEPRFIRTVPKLGYGYIGPTPDASVIGPSAIEPSEAPRGRWPRWRLGAAIVVVALLAGALILTNVLSTGSAEWPEPGARRKIVVLPFTNESGDPSAAWLQNGLPNMLITGLGRSAGVSAVTLADLEDVGAAVMRADLVVRGSFSSVGQSLRVDVRMHTRSGEPFGVDSMVAERREDVLAEIDRLSGRLTARLGVAPPGSGAVLQIADVMTSDLDAYREYVFGVQKASALEPDAAIERFESAVTRDPGFAMAHARIGATYVITIGEPDKGRAHLAKAFQLSSRLREVDRLWILAWYSLAKLEYDEAMAPLRTLIARYPTDLEAYSVLARLLIGRERWTDALQVIEQGLALDPDAKDLHNQASAAAAGAGRPGAALEAARRYVAVAPDEANARDTLGLRLQDLGRYDEAIEAYRQALALNPGFHVARVHMGNTYFAQGRYREAASAWEPLTRQADLETRARGLGALGWLAYRRGDLAAAWRLALEAATLSPRNPWPAFHVAIARQDRAGYRRIAGLTRWDEYSNRGAPHARIFQHYMWSLGFLIEGRVDEALTQLREAVRHPPIGWGVEPLHDSLAEAYFDLERWDDARAEYERLVTQRPWFARPHYRLAQLADRRNDPAAARGHYERFLEAWNKADADVPEVVAARERLRRLTE